MVVVSWVLGHLPKILFVLLVGGLVGTLVDSAYSWFFDDDSVTTNALVVGGITLSIILPLIAHLVHRGSLEQPETDP